MTFIFWVWVSLRIFKSASWITKRRLTLPRLYHIICSKLNSFLNKTVKHVYVLFSQGILCIARHQLYERIFIILILLNPLSLLNFRDIKVKSSIKGIIYRYPINTEHFHTHIVISSFFSYFLS